jgi:hypothetical protein
VVVTVGVSTVVAVIGGFSMVVAVIGGFRVIVGSTVEVVVVLSVGT